MSIPYTYPNPFPSQSHPISISHPQSIPCSSHIDPISILNPSRIHPISISSHPNPKFHIPIPHPTSQSQFQTSFSIPHPNPISHLSIPIPYPTPYSNRAHPEALWLCGGKRLTESLQGRKDIWGQREEWDRRARCCEGMLWGRKGVQLGGIGSQNGGMDSRGQEGAHGRVQGTLGVRKRGEEVGGEGRTGDLGTQVQGTGAW